MRKARYCSCGSIEKGIAHLQVLMHLLVLLVPAVLLLPVSLGAQTRTVSGQVVDEEGRRLAGVSVILKGTALGVLTDTAGLWQMEVPPGGAVLSFSRVDLKDLAVVIGGDDLLVGRQVMVRREGLLNETVVVAYGIVLRKDITGSVGTVAGEALRPAQFASVDKSLQGMVAGLQSSSGSGAPGAATDIRIRGTGSAMAGAGPLWVIDGAIATTADLTVNTATANPLSTLAACDIESITVLKDAASTAIYGSRGAGGVILVTTRRGRPGKTRFECSAMAGTTDRAYRPAVRPMTSLQYRSVLRQAVINGGYATDAQGADKLISNPAFLGFPADWVSHSTDWQDVVSRRSGQSEYDLHLSGGTERTKIYASISHYIENGTTLATSLGRFAGDLSVTHQATEKMRISVSLNGSNTSQHTPYNGGAYNNPVLAAAFLMPWYSPYNSDGSFRFGDPQGEFPLTGGTYNPVVIAAWDKNQAQQTGLRGSAGGEYAFSEMLRLTSRFAAEYLLVQEDQYENPYYGDGYGKGGYAFSAFTRVFNYTWSNYADWKQRLGRDGGFWLSVKAGTEAQNFSHYTLRAAAQDLPRTMGLEYPASGSRPVQAYAAPDGYAVFSLLGSMELNYRDRYVLSGSLRGDESSVFGADHRWGSFYSAGVVWNIGQTELLKRAKIIDMLRLRLSYGVNGNSSGFGYYSAMATYGSGYNYGGSPGIAPNNLGDPGLTWEKNGILNLGMDLSCLKDRIGGTIEFYQRRTKDLLTAVPLSLTSGFSSQAANAGGIGNSGVEFTLRARPVATECWGWDLSFTLSHNVNKVLSLYQGRPVAAGNYRYTVGHDLQAFYLPQWAGVDPESGAPMWYRDGSRKEKTKDYNNATPALYGSAAPRFYGGVFSAVHYRGLGLKLQVNYNYGNDIYDNWFGYLNSEGQYLGGLNQWTSQLGAWQKPGDNTSVPRIVLGGNANSNANSTRALYRGDYIRLRVAEISYSLSPTLLRKWHLAGLTAYIRGTNLATWGADRRLPYDPEAGVGSVTNMEVYMPRTVAAGIGLTW